jgi:Na+-transporting NADH:ubiquinone oxidoreductase subunit F
MVKGTLIECAKHNGRFDVRDGSPQRLPVCVGLKTFAVRESSGKLQLDLTSPSGHGITTPAPTYTFHVVSNENVATFIKELVLEPDSASAELKYQPGDYLQFNIPAYQEHTLQNIEVGLPYAAVWQAQDLFNTKVSNPVPCRRIYSIATNPAIDKQLRFNVRIATPPRGIPCNAGSGSSFLFGLKRGDNVTAIGPYGEFHIRESGREMVYIGGGTGMAPIRSHLSNLLETRKTTVRVSYWYGARSLREVFYQDYFEDLARQNGNFTFRIALSEPQPEDQWQSHTGFIHDVLRREVLYGHPNPQSIDYFLCGPPAMIQAATVMLKNLGVPPTQIAYDEF